MAEASRFLDRTTPPKIVTLTLLAGLVSLSINCFMPSLPGMAAYFHAPYALMQLSVALYLALSAVLQVVVGPISDRFGRRAVMLTTLVLFLLATIGTLLAPSAQVFLLFRMAQAVIAAGTVLSRAVVRDVVTDSAEAASMMGYVTMGMSLVPMIGPIIGGFLDEAFGWQANFGLLLGSGVVVLALTWADMGETATLKKLSFAQQLQSYPGLLTSRRFWGYCGAAAFTAGTFYAFLGGAPFVGSQVFHLSASQIGLYFAFCAAGYFAGNFLTGRFAMRLGMNRMVLLGTVVNTAGLGLLALLTALHLSGPLVFFTLTIAMGLGNGIALPSANAGMLSVRPDLAGTASGLGGAIMIGGGAGLAALAAALLDATSSEMPLVLLMLASSLASMVCILAVIRRARKLGLGA